jgi:hypothetical protein
VLNTSKYLDSRETIDKYVTLAQSSVAIKSVIGIGQRKKELHWGANSTKG